MNEKIKILVVDDEPDVVEIVSYNLKKENFEIFKAYNGKEAIESVRLNLPNLIIMDIRMPEMSGIETCRAIRNDDKLKHIPILFLTADSDEYTSMSAMEAGGDHFITKPIRPALLVGMIQELIN